MWTSTVLSKKSGETLCRLKGRLTVTNLGSEKQESVARYYLSGRTSIQGDRISKSLKSQDQGREKQDYQLHAQVEPEIYQANTWQCSIYMRTLETTKKITVYGPVY